MKKSNSYLMSLKRLLAFFIDIIIFSIPIIIIYNIGLGDITPKIITIISIWLYFAIMESSNRQGTLGKNILKIKVVNERGKTISFGKAILRHIGKILSMLAFQIGFFMIFFTKKQQCLHDKIVKTYVIKKDEYVIEDDRQNESNFEKESKGKLKLTTKSIILLVMLLCLFIGSIFTISGALNFGSGTRGISEDSYNVSAEKSIINLSGNSQDATFIAALKLAKEKQKNSTEDFVTLFGKSFKEIDPSAMLAPIYTTLELKGKVKYNSTDKEILDLIRAENKTPIDIERDNKGTVFIFIEITVILIMNFIVALLFFFKLMRAKE